jgi:hypothetical protein
MKNLLALVGAVVVLVVGLGWYLQWFKFGSESGTPGHPKFNVEVEADKIKADLKKGKATVGEFIKEHENGKGVPGQPTSLPLNPDGTFTVPQLPPLPPLPAPPTPLAPGTVPSNIVIPPPPPFAPGQ